MKYPFMRSLGLRWRIAIAYWTVLFILATFATAAWAAVSVSVNGPQGNYFGFDGISDTFRIMTDLSFITFMVITMGVFIGLQLLMLLPVRYPRTKTRGKPVWLAIAAASLLAAILVVALIAAVVGVLGEYDLLDSIPIDSWWGVAGVVAVHWALMVPLMAAFVKRQHGESVTRKLSMLLFVGSIVDVAAMIPLDVMIRRKTDCYSWSTSMFSLGTAAAIGMLAMGPAVWLPISCRRRRRWFETRCSACGYDMTGGGTQCPECGTAFQALESTLQPRPIATLSKNHHD